MSKDPEHCARCLALPHLRPCVCSCAICWRDRPPGMTRLEDGTRVRVKRGPNAGREGVVYDQVQGESKVQLDGDEAGAWWPNERLELCGFEPGSDPGSEAP